MHLANAVLGYTPPEAKKFVEIVVVKLFKKLTINLPNIIVLTKNFSDIEHFQPNDGELRPPLLLPSTLNLPLFTPGKVEIQQLSRTYIHTRSASPVKSHTWNTAHIRLLPESHGQH